MWALAADIIGDILTHSTFIPEELERERGVILQEIGQANDTPDDIIFDHFQDHRLSRPADGPPDARAPRRSSRACSGPTLTDYMRHHYGPERMVVAAAGAVDHDRLLDLVQTHFARPAAGRRRRRPRPRATLAANSARSDDLEQVHIVLGFPSAGYKDRLLLPDRCCSSTLLGGGMSSRLFQEIREKRGLVYSIYSFAHPFQDGGALRASMPAPGRRRPSELVPVTLEELRKVQTDVTQDELDRAKAQFRASLLMSTGEHRQPHRTAGPADPGAWPHHPGRGDQGEDRRGHHRGRAGSRAAPPSARRRRWRRWARRARCRPGRDRRRGPSGMTDAEPVRRGKPAVRLRGDHDDPRRSAGPRRRRPPGRRRCRRCACWSPASLHVHAGSARSSNWSGPRASISACGSSLASGRRSSPRPIPRPRASRRSPSAPSPWRGWCRRTRMPAWPMRRMGWSRSTSTWPTRDEPNAAALIARAAAAEDAALAVAGVSNSEGAERRLGPLRHRHGRQQRLRRRICPHQPFHLGHRPGRAGDGDGAGLRLFQHRPPVDLEDAAMLGRRAGEKAVARLNPPRPKTARIPVVYDPRVASSLLGHLARRHQRRCGRPRHVVPRRQARPAGDGGRAYAWWTTRPGGAGCAAGPSTARA